MIATRFCTLYLFACLLWAGAALAQAADFASALPLARGKVVGVVSVVGALEKPKPLPVFKSRSFCGASVPNETLLISADGRLRNAAVILRPLSTVAAPQPKTVVLDNQHCAFTPHVQVVPVGSELLLKNSDPILHTVHARLGQETLFNIGLPKWRQVIKRLDRGGVIRIDCDVLHTWMSAAIIVTDSPYYFVSNDKGEFFFDGIPAGAYEIEIWHERLGVKTRQFSVSGNSLVSLDIVYAKGEKSR